ncbi:hypothetical protein D9M68_818690 [compost metagenome]
MVRLVVSRRQKRIKCAGKLTSICGPLQEACAVNRAADALQDVLVIAVVKVARHLFGQVTVRPEKAGQPFGGLVSDPAVWA